MITLTDIYDIVIIVCTVLACILACGLLFTYISVPIPAALLITFLVPAGVSSVVLAKLWS